MNVVAGLTEGNQAKKYTETQAALAADYLARAKAIAPLIEREAEATERGSMITKAVHDAFVDNNLYWMVIPQELSGPGLNARAAMETVEEISRADGSTGWSLMANAFNNGMAAGFLPDDGADELFGGKDKIITCGQFSPGGKAMRADGGLRGGGHYKFGSGCGHADWIGGGVAIYENGKPRLRADGTPDSAVVFVPRGKYELRGNWDVIGLLGTASFDYEIPDQFVPDRYIMDGSALPTKPARGGPLFHFGWFGFGSAGHSAIALGITKRALEEVAKIVHNKSRMGYVGSVHEHPVFKYQFTYHEAAYWAARHLALDAFEKAEATIAAGQPVTAEQLSRFRQACTFVHKTAVEVVGFCHHWGASQAFRNPTALGRCTRDLSVATQHVIADETSLVDHADPIFQTWLPRKA